MEGRLAAGDAELFYPNTGPHMLERDPLPPTAPDYLLLERRGEIVDRFEAGELHKLAVDAVYLHREPTVYDI